MMSLGPIGFLAPLGLFGLLVLPVIWWLLRLTPPRPKRLMFPPTKIIKKVLNEEKTPRHSPWWLTLLRLLAAACLVLALSGPVLHPQEKLNLNKDGPVILIVDNGWTASNDWKIRQAVMKNLIQSARENKRLIYLVPLAEAENINEIGPLSPEQAEKRMHTIKPHPFAPERVKVLKALAEKIKNVPNADIYWLSDGVIQQVNSLPTGHSKYQKLLSTNKSTQTNDNKIQPVDETVEEIALIFTKLQAQGHHITQLNNPDGKQPLALRAHLGPKGVLQAQVLRSQARLERSVIIMATNPKGENLGRFPFKMAKGEQSVTIPIELPFELRNQISSLSIFGERSAGSTFLLDKRSNWRRIGLISGESDDSAQPLLSPLYYIRRALAPFSETVSAQTRDVASAVENFTQLNASVIVMADIGRLTGAPLLRLSEWVESGGVLIRFAGPNMEQGQDTLIPVKLRSGGRRLGGALSWTVPQTLAPFDDDSPFYGLTLPKDIQINRQVLADPTQLQDGIFIWARLSDGTPLVTAKKDVRGWLVLFHVTANSDWSNLPLSGLFVEMLNRLSQLSPNIAIDREPSNNQPQSKSNGEIVNQTLRRDELETDNNSSSIQGSDQQKTGHLPNLKPYRVLSGFGQLIPPNREVEAVSLDKIRTLTPSRRHPPGFYGPKDQVMAINIMRAKDKILPLSLTIIGLKTENLILPKQKDLRALFYGLALLALLIDSLIMVFMRRRFQTFKNTTLKSPTVRKTSMASCLFLGLTASFLLVGINGYAYAENNQRPDAHMKAALATHLAFVKTGNKKIDSISLLGLKGLGHVLRTRTAVEPSEPIGVNIEKDELAFYPVLYWPVKDDVRPLSNKAAQKLNAYMRHGGMIIFDTQDLNEGGFISTQNLTPLGTLLKNLDIPRLAPVAPGHVVTKSFYLLSSFPGRYSHGKLWAEAKQKASGRGQKSRIDEVSTLLITSNDLAGAWAMDSEFRPLFPAIPGGELQREMAYRVGVNIVMYALAGNYKADQVHVPALLERLGQ